MKRTTTILSTIALLVLTNCAGNHVSSISVMSSPSTVSQADIDKLQKKLNEVKAAINVGDFVAARNEFSKVEATWKVVKGSVKDKPNGSYTKVEAHMNEVERTLYHKPLSRERAILSLHALGKSIKNANAL